MSLTFQQNLSYRYPERFRVEDSRLGLQRAYNTVLQGKLTWYAKNNNTNTNNRTQHRNASIQTTPGVQGTDPSYSNPDRTRESLGSFQPKGRTRRSIDDDPGSVVPKIQVQENSLEESLASAFHGLSLFIVVVLLTEVMIAMTSFVLWEKILLNLLLESKKETLENHTTYIYIKIRLITKFRTWNIYTCIV